MECRAADGESPAGREDRDRRIVGDLAKSDDGGSQQHSDEGRGKKETEETPQEPANEAPATEEDSAQREVYPSKAKFGVAEYVYARDEPTGLLYKAVIRKHMRGPKSKQVNVHLVEDVGRFLDEHGGHIGDGRESSKQGSARMDVLEEENEETWCCHYFIHYMGWNVKWDRWIEESAVLPDNPHIATLAKNLIDAQRVIQRKEQVHMSQLFKGEPHRKEYIKALQVACESKKTAFKKMGAANHTWSQLKILREFTEAIFKVVLPDHSAATGKQADPQVLSSTADNSNNNKQDDHGTKNKKASKGPAKTSTKVGKLKRLSSAEWEHEKNLRLRDLTRCSGYGAAASSIAERLPLPFTLKKILVEEWEIVSQCNMVPKLPAVVSIRQALNDYLQAKLELIRNQQGSENDEDAPLNSHASNEEMNAALDEKSQEWEDMVSGVTQLFNEALPGQLLYRNEVLDAKQYKKKVESKLQGMDTATESHQPCDIYGCEYLLRLVVQLPSILMSGKHEMTDTYLRRALAKVGDLIRFLQKHQTKYFVQAYKRSSVAPIASTSTGANSRTATSNAADGRKKSLPSTGAGSGTKLDDVGPSSKKPRRNSGTSVDTKALGGAGLKKGATMAGTSKRKFSASGDKVTTVSKKLKTTKKQQAAQSA